MNNENMDNKEIYNSVYSVHNVKRSNADPYAVGARGVRHEIVSKYCKGKDALDVGCAIGHFLLPHVEECKSAIGLDYSKQYLDYFKQRIRDNHPRNLTLLEGDAKDMPIDSESIDFAFSYATLYCIPKVEEVIAELGRVLRKDGVVALEFGNKRSFNTLITNYRTEHENWVVSHNRSMDEIYCAMKEAGFEVLETRRFQLFPLLTVPRKLLWMRPLSGNLLRPLLGIKLKGGRILDEVVSGAPLLRKFAFSNIIIARKI